MRAERPGARPALLTDPRAADAFLVLVCLALTALAVKTPWAVLPRPVIAVAGITGSAAQWYRRRWPPIAAVLGAAGYVLSGNPGPWLVGLYSGAAYGSRRRIVAASAVAGWAGIVAYLWIDDGRPHAESVLAATGLAALIVAAGAYQATRRALLASLRERAAQAEAQRVLREEAARGAERDRIAREMHDVLAHKVSLIALHAGALELGAGTDAERVRQVAGTIRVAAREALQELRTVLGMLAAVPDPPLAEALVDLAALVRDSVRAGQPVELRDDAGPLPPATARVVYRVAQEGLTNANRYASGAPTTVSVGRTGDGCVTVTVHNEQSSGPETDWPGSGSGLIGLAERIRLVGGTLDSGPLGPNGRDGWLLRAVVPCLDGGVPADVP